VPCYAIHKRHSSQRLQSVVGVFSELACLFGEPGRAVNTNRYDLRPKMRSMESDVCQINASG